MSFMLGSTFWDIRKVAGLSGKAASPDRSTLKNAQCLRSNLEQAVEPSIGVSVKEACHLLGVGRTTVYQLIKSGELDVYHVGKRTLVIRESVFRFVEEQQTRHS